MGEWNEAAIWVGSLSLLMIVGSIAVAWVIIVRMPVDYLTRDPRNEASFRSRHPVIRVTLLIFKNISGLALMITGVVMLLTPGQGVLCIFIGMTLTDFPGKQELIRRMLGRRKVLRLINGIREKAIRPPLNVPAENESAVNVA